MAADVGRSCAVDGMGNNSGSNQRAAEKFVPGIVIPYGITLAAAELLILKATLARCYGNKTDAAAILGISLKTVYNLTRPGKYTSVRSGNPCVYCVRDDARELVKIGWTSSQSLRLRDLVLASGVDLRVIGSITASCINHAREIERDLHQKFSKFRQVGEWFDDVNEQVSSAFRSALPDGARA